jgi:hypothetical protein
VSQEGAGEESDHTLSEEMDILQSDDTDTDANAGAGASGAALPKPERPSQLYLTDSICFKMVVSPQLDLNQLRSELEGAEEREHFDTQPRSRRVATKL